MSRRFRGLRLVPDEQIAVVSAAEEVRCYMGRQCAASRALPGLECSFSRLDVQETPPSEPTADAPAAIATAGPSTVPALEREAPVTTPRFALAGLHDDIAAQLASFWRYAPPQGADAGALL